MGATVQFDECSRVFNCDAPVGYVWHCNGCRAIPVQWDNGSQTWLVKAIADVIANDLSAGLDKVTDEQEIEAHEWDTGEPYRAAADAPDFIAWPK